MRGGWGGETDLEGFDDVGAHEGLLGGPRGLEGVVLAGLPLLALCLLEAGHQALHPLMHPHVCPIPPLPADRVPSSLQPGFE